MIAVAVALFAPAWLPVAGAQNVAPTTGTPPPAAVAEAPVIAPDADKLLKEMAAYVGSAEQFTFHAEISFDHVLPSGQKLQFAAAEDVALQRPGGLYVEWSGDLGDRQFWYDGKSVTLYDPSTPFYASESAPPELDKMLGALLPKLSFAPPLSDLLYSNPYQQVRDKIQFGFDLGTNDVNGQSCRTFAFVQQDIDWQIWINPGPQLVPCKLVITYKGLPSQPQFSAVFTDWDFAPRIAPSVFVAAPPVGATQIPFTAIAQAK
jgi:hypothetical protein